MNMNKGKLTVHHGEQYTHKSAAPVYQEGPSGRPVGIRLVVNRAPKWGRALTFPGNPAAQKGPERGRKIHEKARHGWLSLPRRDRTTTSVVEQHYIMLVETTIIDRMYI